MRNKLICFLKQKHLVLLQKAVYFNCTLSPASGEVCLSRILNGVPPAMTDHLLVAHLLYVCMMDWLKLEEKKKTFLVLVAFSVQT